MAAWLAIRIVLAFKARIEEQLLLAQFSRVRRVPKQHETVRPISVLNPFRIGPLKVLRHHVDEPRHSTRRSSRAQRGARLAEVIHTSRSLVDRLEMIDDMPLANRAEMLFDLLR
jgi:hypothetical protein